MQIIDDKNLFEQIKLGDTTAANQLIEQVASNVQRVPCPYCRH